MRIDTLGKITNLHAPAWVLITGEIGSACDIELDKFGLFWRCGWPNLGFADRQAFGQFVAAFGWCNWQGYWHGKRGTPNRDGFDAVELIIQDLHHMAVAAARCFPAKHNANQPNTIAFNRGNKIESRCINIACLDTICAAIFCQKLVMIAVFPAFPVKALGAEIFIKLRKIAPHGNG